MYGKSFENYDNLSQKVILSCHNDDVTTLNSKILSRFQGNVRRYYSLDFAKPRGADQREEDIALDYQIEYLNSLRFPGFSGHNKLQLKIGAIITRMLLRNICV